MKCLLSLALIAGLTSLASAQVSAPAVGQNAPPLKPAPSLTVINARKMTIHRGSSVMEGTDFRFELLGPRQIEVDEAEHFMATDTTILRGVVTMRSAVQ